MSFRSLTLAFGVSLSFLLQAASPEMVSANLTTGFLSTPVPDRFWAMATSYRASFGPDGIQLMRHGRRAAIRFPGASLHWQSEGPPLASINFMGASTRSGAGVTAIRAANAYSGVDIVLRMQDGRLKSEFQLQAGVSPATAGYCVEGAEVRAGPRGETLYFDAGAEWQWGEEGLVSWQSRSDGSRVPVSSSFALHGSCVGFRLGAVDPALPLTIDPDLVFSSYLGGGLFDAITAVATDAQGNVYVGGWTESSDFPVLSGYQASPSGRIDGFVAKINPSGQLVFSTYLGGSAEDRVLALTLSGAGIITVAGHTSSSNFPTASAAFGSLTGGRDAFVTRLSALGNSLLFSTYLGGSGNDAALGLAVDPGGIVVVAGETASTNFPTLNAYRAANAGGVDGFVTRLSSAGSLLSSTYWGGAGDDRIRGIAVSPDGNLHLTGATASSNLPTINAAYPSLRGSMDAFYTRFNSVASGLAICTYLGGTGGNSLNEESGYGIAIDTMGRAWIAGVTPSTDFPGVSGGYQSGYGGGVSDAFIAVFTAGATMEWATYLGGSGLDAATSIAAGSGFVGLSGYTTSTNLPLAGALQATNAGTYDAFWAAFPTTSPTPLYISYLGGAGSDSAAASAASGSSLTIAGSTLSANFPLVTATQYANPGTYGGFASRIRFGPGPIAVSPSSGAALTQSFQFTISHANGNASLSNAEFLFNSSFSFVNGCYYSLDRTNNLLRLYQDAGNTWLSAAIGSGTVLNNGLCSTPASAVTVSTTASAMSVVFPVTFSPSFPGAKTVYANATDSAGLGAGWPQVGSWLATAASAPTVVAPTPSAGSGLAQSFSFPFNDANGAGDIATIYILFNTTVSAADGCYFRFNRADNTISLFRDSDAAMLPVTLGVNTTVENTNCSINGAAASVAAAGNTLTLVVPITFKPAFYGTRGIFGSVTDFGNLSSGWQSVGSWTPVPIYAPAVVSATPASGGGGSQTFTVTLSDGNGYTDIATASFLWQTSVNTLNACYVTYIAATNTFRLFRDSDSAQLPITPGATSTVENANCSLSGTGLSVSGNGSQLTFTLPLTFKAPFAGTRNIYAAVSDIGGLASGWQAIGTWNPYPAYAPTVVSVSPSTGSGLSQSFSFQYADGNGNADIGTLTFLFNATPNPATGCYITFSRAANALSLYNPVDSTWNSLTPGSVTTIQNSYCAIAGAGISTSASGDNFFLTLPITFKSPSFGNLNIFTIATDQSGSSSGWIAAGAWIATGAAPPVISSLTPASGTATAQSFTATITDPNGSADIATVQFLINPTTATANGCYLSYSRAANTVSLFQDSNASWLPVTIGSATTVSTSFCTLSGTGLTVTPSGNSLTIVFPLSFKPTFTGAKTLFLSATDAGGLTSGWISSGSWTLTQPTAPTVNSLSPNSGSAASQTFTLVFGDLNGYTDIAGALLLVNATLNGRGGCFIAYDRPTNLFFLYRDSDDAWIAVYPGSGNDVSNAQCTINTANLATSVSGNSVTVTLPLTFSASFTGLKNFFANVSDAGGLSSSWVTAGTWNPGQPVAPTVTSLTPSSGSGLNQIFTVTLNDANGVADIASAQFVINPALNGLNSCYISYNRSANAFYLYRDSVNVWQLVYPGTNTGAANNNCALAGTGLTVTASGNSLTITLPLTFNAAYNGANNFYVYVADTAGLNSGWINAGTWRAGQASAPAVTSVTPNAGSGPSQTFSVILSDTNGNADISSALLLVNSTLNGQNACFISYNRSANAFYLFRDSDNVWQLIYPGSSGSVTNGFCTINGTALAAAASGNTLTLSLPLTFSSNFTGAKNFYAYVADAGGLNSGWITAGTWNPSASSPPTVTSLTPSAGAGNSRTFTLTFSDANGNADIASALVLLNGTLNGNNACFISYNRSVNAFYLLRDSDGVWQPIYPGTATSVTNPNCTLSGSALAATASGNTLTLILPLSFKPAFAGLKNTYVSVTDGGGLTSGVVTAGTWTAN